MAFRKLDDRRIGLLIRMSYHRACVCRKSTQEPLLKRGFTKSNGRAYELTPAGKKFVEEYVKANPDGNLETWPGVSIGTEVLMLRDSGRE